MNDPITELQHDLRRAAPIIGLTLAMVALAVLLYYLVDILLILFLGIVVAAALQPWHVHLVRRGVPRGAAVLLIYLLFLGGLSLIGLLVAPVVMEQVTAFATSAPDKYTEALEALRGSRMALLRMIGQRLPSFGALVSSVAGVAPTFTASLVGFTAGLLSAFAYLITVFAVAFYWTMELPRWERLVLSFLPVARRASMLTIWHEIEFNLGAFIRAQGIAMLVIGVASGVGYAFIGLPNALALGVLAGLLEVVPLIGPLVAAVPAVLVALPLGMTPVLLVIGWSLVLQGIENNVLIPRLMSHAVGVSALVGLLAVFAFGMLYGVLGIFIAIPLTAVIQVILDRMLINTEPAAVDAQMATPLEELQARVEALRQQVRRRFRERDARVGIDPRIPDHVVDAADQQLEKAVERVATMINTVQAVAGTPGSEEHAEIVESLDDATQHIEQALERSSSVAVAGDETSKRPEPLLKQSAKELENVNQHVEHVVERAETVIASAQTKSDRSEPSATTDEATESKKGAVDNGDTGAGAGGDVERAVERARTTMRQAEHRRYSKKPKRGGPGVPKRASE